MGIFNAVSVLLDLTREDPWVWRLLTWVVVSIAAASILYFFAEVGYLLQFAWRETVGSWLLDREARRFRQRIAADLREADAERQRLSKASVTVIRRRG
jgi:hypothetical protein